MSEWVNKVDIKDDVIYFLESQEQQFVKYEEIFDYIWANVIEVQKQSKYNLAKNIRATLSDLDRERKLLIKRVKLIILYKIK